MSEIQERCNKYSKAIQGDASAQTSALHQDEHQDVRLAPWIYSYPSLFDLVKHELPPQRRSAQPLHALQAPEWHQGQSFHLGADTNMFVVGLNYWPPSSPALCGEAPGRDCGRHRMTQVKWSYALSLERMSHR